MRTGSGVAAAAAAGVPGAMTAAERRTERRRGDMQTTLYE